VAGRALRVRRRPKAGTATVFLFLCDPCDLCAKTLRVLLDLCDL